MGKNTQQKTASGLRKEKITREFSSGGVVFRRVEEQESRRAGVLWLVRKTAKSKLFPNQYWMLPKGRIDDTDHDEPGPMSRGDVRATESALQKAAIREVREEAGVDIKIIKKIKTIMYSFALPGRGKILKFVTFYLMEWVSDLPEGFDHETEEVRWLGIDEAVKTLSFSGEKQILKKAREILEG